MNNPFIAKFDGEAALVNPAAHAAVSTLLNGMANHELANIVMCSTYAAGDAFWTELGDYSARIRPYSVRGGILMIPVKGVLLKDFPYQFYSYATGYEYIRAAFDRGLVDPDVKGIAFVFDTPGGMVAGNFDLVDHIHASRGVKPIAGFAMEGAYSAGYSLISSADPGRVYVARTGGVGSIGVVTSHVDMSAAMEKFGIKVTFIHAGKYKVEGNPYENLSDEAKARIQARIDGLYSIFVATVARNRGMDEKAVRATEALTFSAEEAVSNGLADSIGSLEDAFAAFAADLSNSQEDDQMFTQEQLDAAVASAKTEAHAAGVKEGTEAGKKDGAAAERARITAIVGSEEAATRPVAAMAAAMDTDMTAEQATAFLAKLTPEAPVASAPANADAPKGKAGAAADFATAMDNAEHPNAGVSTEMTDDQRRKQRRQAAAAAAGRLKVVDQ